MSKALEIVKEECSYAFGGTANGDRVRENLHIIEQELKDGEEYRLKYSQINAALCKLREEKTKKEQAFDIIIAKCVHPLTFGMSSDCEDYNKIVCDSKKLTQEEYDLIKELCVCH